MQAVITRTDIPGLDWLVAFPLGALLVTVFVVAGVANAVNIIDGFNGLASMCVVIMLIGLAYVAFAVDDRLIALLALAGVGAVLGFFVWNFPAGLVFLGDGGAYFLGFYVAELGHPAAASQSRRVADVSAAALHLSGLRNAVFDLPAQVARVACRWACPTARTCTA